MSGVVLHVGLPKTGTTSLQRAVYPRLPGVLYAGKMIPSYGFVTPELSAAVAATISADGVFGDPAPRLREAVGALRREAGGDTLLISTESLVHPAARDISLAADRLASAIPDARILITIRAQESLALSWYRSHGRFAMYLFLHKFESERIPAHLTQRDWWTFVTREANSGLLAMLDLDAIVSCYQSRFGGRVTILPLETVAHDRAFAARTLAGTLETDAAACEELLATAHENRGLTAREAILSRVLLQFGFRRDFLERRDQSAFRRWLARGPVADAALDPAIATEIARRYSDGNTRLAERMGVELRALGYS